MNDDYVDHCICTRHQFPNRYINCDSVINVKVGCWDSEFLSVKIVYMFFNLLAVFILVLLIWNIKTLKVVVFMIILLWLWSKKQKSCD